MDGAMSGMFDALDDPYTSYLPKETNQQLMELTDGKYEGIGVYVSINAAYNTVTVLSPLKDSPADRAGILPLDKIISIKVVNNIDEAILHINKYNTKHSEAIITSNYDNVNKFLDEVDASTVYVNASTRFTDGDEFGFGAEIGISTQKLHARGPMGLEALTSYKYIVLGNGQIR